MKWGESWVDGQVCMWVDQRERKGRMGMELEG